METGHYEPCLNPMIEDIQMQRLPPSQGIEIYIGKHFKALSDGFCGLVHYHCWKSSLLNVTSSSQPLEGEPAKENKILKKWPLEFGSQEDM
ncbi:hypothetical protein E2C01_039308 [Portunus trituberculatus]|uniref:Uncharacterized protein n=1 Tax=Portunus trituberculatus TaxID=210409 RepID=A0A5B7FMP1_PORTR|nr:hypothetical protein [Portunus trituberculatus]